MRIASSIRCSKRKSLQRIPLTGLPFLLLLFFLQQHLLQTHRGNFKTEKKKRRKEGEMGNTLSKLKSFASFVRIAVTLLTFWKGDEWRSWRFVALRCCLNFLFRVCVCSISVPTLHCERKKVPGINSSISLWKSLPIVSIVFQKMLVQQPWVVLNAKIIRSSVKISRGTHRVSEGLKYCLLNRSKTDPKAKFLPLNNQRTLV